MYIWFGFISPNCSAGLTDKHLHQGKLCVVRLGLSVGKMGAPSPSGSYKQGKTSSGKIVCCECNWGEPQIHEDGCSVEMACWLAAEAKEEGNQGRKKAMKHPARWSHWLDPSAEAAHTVPLVTCRHVSPLSYSGTSATTVLHTG